MFFKSTTLMRGRLATMTLPAHPALGRMLHLKTLVTFLFISFLTFGTKAQCTMYCNGYDINNPNQASLDENCEIILTADAILEAEESCPGPKSLQVKTQSGEMVADGPAPVTINGDYADQVLTITVIDDNSGNTCWGYLLIQDKQVPNVNCTAMEVLCSESLEPENIGFADITDNCDTDLDLQFFDEIDNGDCANGVNTTITRTWIATDDSGNQNTCEQIITLTRPDISTVVFPDDIELDCDNPDTDPSNTGQPTLDGNPIFTNDFCHFTVDSSDDIIPLCGPVARKIIRTWTVFDHCTGESRVRSHLIKILDTTEPDISCPGSVNVETDFNACDATVVIPTPTVTDDCSGFTVNVHTSYGSTGQGVHFNVPAGTHTIHYTAIDDCNNSSTCETTLTVFDNEAPTVVCDDLLLVSLNSSGVAAVPATSIDENSHDNCTANLEFSAARMGIDEFGPVVPFDCNDIGQTIMVILRVHEANNPDLFSECMSEIQVEDKLPPIVFCPQNLTIDCDSDISDLSIFGTPQVQDACGFTLSESTNSEINDCGEGTIFRTFSATDPSGNVSSECVQQIQLENLSPFTESQIDWPEDFTTDMCGALTDPDNLPTGSDYPVVDNTSCGLVAASFTDEVYEFAGDACIKVIRTWKVIDWCTFNPVNPEDGGQYIHVQVIKVMDNEDPVISCPSNVVAAVDGNCVGANVTIGLPTATDCSNNIQFTNDSPFAHSSGRDASGYYPLGETTVTFVAWDGCGNSSSCTITVTVEDQKAPTPLCIVGLSSQLMPMNGGGMAMVEADYFNRGSSDNCSSPEDLIFTITTDSTLTSPPSTSTLQFDCAAAQLDEVPIFFWVTDEAGNSAYCETFIVIQDNNNVCQSFNVISVSGATRTFTGDEVDDTKVMLDMPQSSMENYTTGDGTYMFYDVPVGESFTLTPQKNINPMNGVSTLDMILITKHILAIERLDSPYKMIAADVNNSGSISTSDIIAIRKLVLQLREDFPNNNSWRFIDATYEFENPENPFGEAFPETIFMENPAGNAWTADFVAVKIGDVNGSAIANNFSEIDERTNNNALVLDLNSQWLESQEDYYLTIHATDFFELQGYQLGLKADLDFVEIVDVKTLIGNDLENNSFAWNQTEGGELFIQWYAPEKAISLQNQSAILQVQLKTKATAQLSEVLKLATSSTKSEAYNSDLATNSIELRYNAPETPVDMVDNEFKLYQNEPNPFGENTTIGFHLPEAGAATLTIYDVAGKVIHEQQGQFVKGHNKIQIDKAVLNSSGVLYYQLKTPRHTATMKMMVL